MPLPPLPPPDVDALHVHAAAGTVGPLSRRTIAARLAQGELQPSDSFWFDGMAGWEELSAHPALVQGLDSGSPAPATTDDQLDKVFGGLVKESWKYYNAHAFASQVDEVFLGAIITATLDTGYSLIDLTSDGTHHYTRFQNLQDNSRIICRLTHLTGDLVRSKVEGHRASVVFGYGERVNDFGRIWQALKAEMKSGYLQSAEPGTITVDGDVNAGYIYVQVDLYLCVDDYVKADYGVRYDVLREHLAATHNALRKYLRGRFAK
jgi:hypothetical protein